MQVKVKRLHPDAIIPQYATNGAACFDLHALDDATVGDGLPVVIRTGLSFEVPEGHVMKVYSRSGHGFKHGIRLANCTGIIDADYRGELMVKLTSDDGCFMAIRKGDRIAQAMIMPVPKVELVEVSELASTERGEGGFGSTGV